MIHVVENDLTGVVEINGHQIDGWIDDTPCTTCASRRIYHTEFDAFFCAECNVWLESNCPDPGCEFCKNRPDKPLQQTGPS